MKITNLHIFESNILDGPMSSYKLFYKEDMTQAEIEQDLLKRRLILGKKHGFDGKKIIVPTQKNHQNPNLYPDGTYQTVSQLPLNQVTDLWNLSVVGDILLLDDTKPGIVIGFPAADCPVLIAFDLKQQVAALAHCGAEYINRELPIDLLKSLENEANSKRSDMMVYLSSCAGKEYCYDQFPHWATNQSVWKNHIQKNGFHYFIDLRGSIVDLLKRYYISPSQLIINDQNTITDPLLYSNSATYRKVPNKNGRYLVGCFFKDEKRKPSN